MNNWRLTWPDGWTVHLTLEAECANRPDCATECYSNLSRVHWPSGVVAMAWPGGREGRLTLVGARKIEAWTS